MQRYVMALLLAVVPVLSSAQVWQAPGFECPIPQWSGAVSYPELVVGDDSKWTAGRPGYRVTYDGGFTIESEYPGDTKLCVQIAVDAPRGVSSLSCWTLAELRTVK